MLVLLRESSVVCSNAPVRYAVHCSLFPTLFFALIFFTPSSSVRGDETKSLAHIQLQGTLTCARRSRRRDRRRHCRDRGGRCRSRVRRRTLGGLGEKAEKGRGGTWKSQRATATTGTDFREGRGRAGERNHGRGGREGGADEIENR